jgi:hypothetical protein
MKLLNKDKIGGAVFLLLVILLSQSRILDMLFNTHLGRLALVSFVLILGYVHKILGVVSVLFIILMFNNSDIALLEGLETKIPAPKKQTVTTTTSKSYTEVVNDKPKEPFEVNVLATERTLQKGSRGADVSRNQDCESTLPFDNVEAFTAF